MQQGRPTSGLPPIVNGLPLGIYAPLPIGNPGQFARYAPSPNPQPGYSPANHPALPHTLARGFADQAPPTTPTYSPPIGSMPSHGSPILPPPSKVGESRVSSPQLSHSRKASIDALSELPTRFSTFTWHQWSRTHLLVSQEPFIVPHPSNDHKVRHRQVEEVDLFKMRKWELDLERYWMTVLKISLLMMRLLNHHQGVLLDCSDKVDGQVRFH